MKIKEDLHSFSPFVFTWHGTKKALTASIHGRTLSTTHKRMVLRPFFPMKKRQLDLTNLVAPRSHIHLRVAHHAVYQA